jgi:hypothetical protein
MIIFNLQTGFILIRETHFILFITRERFSIGYTLLYKFKYRFHFLETLKVLHSI